MNKPVARFQVILSFGVNPGTKVKFRESQGQREKEAQGLVSTEIYVLAEALYVREYVGGVLWLPAQKIRNTLGCDYVPVICVYNSLSRLAASMVMFLLSLGPHRALSAAPGNFIGGWGLEIDGARE